MVDIFKSSTGDVVIRGRTMDNWFCETITIEEFKEISKKILGEEKENNQKNRE